ncbi:MAG: hypothetical protein ABJB86_18740 [Bacteroidota bacterium]
MKYTVPVFVVVALLFTACKNNPSINTAAKTVQQDSVPMSQRFFPVPDYIGGQVKIIDSLKLPLSMSVKINNKTTFHESSDSALRFWAQKFQQPDIGDSALKNQYTETSIADQSVPSVTFIYSTTNTALTIQKINVFVKPDPVENDKVTGIYMEKIFMLNDTIFNQKLYWKTGKNMQVITEKQIKGITFPPEQVKITWDASE